MSSKTLILYQSKTGFTKQYAEQIAQAAGADLLPLARANAAALAGYDTLVFGGRAFAGKINGWSKARRLLFAKPCSARRWAVFVTGATPGSAAETIGQLWAQSLTAAEQANLPHFYLQSGLCYEKMPLVERWMMKGLDTMLRKKKDKTEKDIAMQRMISSSFDASDPAYAAPVIEWIRAGK